MSAALNPEPVFDARRLELIRLGREVNAKAGIPAPDEVEITAVELRAI